MAEVPSRAGPDAPDGVRGVTFDAPHGRADGDAGIYVPSMFESLRVRDFRFLWVSNLAATFGMHMQIVARGWLIYDLTRSAMALSWVMLSFMLPSFVFSLAGGVIADRLRKKAIMLISQVLNACSTALLGWIIYTGRVTFAHFIYFGIFNGTVLSFSMPARTSVVPEVVGRKSLVNAMALQSATFNLSRILGPALAGALIAVFAHGNTTSTEGVGIVFFVIAVFSVVSVISTAQLNYSGAPLKRAGSTAIEDMKEGVRYMRDERLVLGLLMLGFVPMTFGFSASSLLPAFNKEVIHGGPEDLGLMMTAMGVGALAGSLALAHVGDIGGKGRMMFMSAYGWAAALGGFAVSSSLWLAMLLGACTGLFGAVCGSVNMSIVQLTVRPEIRGRVMSLMMMAQGLMPIGILPISAVAEKTGIHIALMLAALLLAISMIWIGRAFPDLIRIDKGHAGEAIAPAAPAAGR